MAMSNSGSRGTSNAYWALKLALGSTAFLAGADKFTNRMVDWEQYLSPAAERRLPISGSTFMKLVGVIEMGVGTLILGRQTRLGSLIASGWLLAIAANLVIDQDYYDIAVRDVNMAVGALTLARLAELRAADRDLGEEPFREVRATVRETSKLTEDAA